MRTRLWLLVGVGVSVAACGREEPKQAWTCHSVAVPGGETLECSRAALSGGTTSYDLTTSGGSSTTTSLLADGMSVGGSEDVSATGGGGGGSGDGSGVTSDGTSVGGSGGGGGTYECVAGSADCPPEGAQPGMNTADGASSTTGGGGGDEVYVCKAGEEDRRDCIKKKPTKCVPGKVPSASGACVEDASSPAPVDGASGTSGGGGAGSSVTTTDNGKTVGLTGVTTNPDGTKTWVYEVCELEGWKDLSNWVLGTGGCEIVDSSPRSGFEQVASDPNSGIQGVKWDVAGHAGCETYSVTTRGGDEGLVRFSTKAPRVSYGLVAGPVCE